MGKSSSLLSELLNLDVLKLGEFMLKGNHLSPLYVDLRHLPSYPKTMNNVVEEINALVKKLGLSVDTVCGVPYNALPFASVLSSRHDIPMLLKRKEAKTYGTKKLVEGVIVPGSTCLLLEDVVVSGSSIKETADILRSEGLVVTDCITILDRLQGGKENLSKFDINLHSLFDINDMLSLYCSLNEVKPSVLENVRHYLRHNMCSLEAAPTLNLKMAFSKRANTCRNPVLQSLFEIIERKRSNLCVAVDVTESSDLLRIAAKVAPHVCMLKTHVDILRDFTEDVSNKLRALAAEHDFLILEDRKFAEIGDMVFQQYQGGMYRIAEWADVVTVHGVPGSGTLDSLKKASNGKARACLLFGQMSSKGALPDSHYTQSVVKVAESYPDFVMGFISQEEIVSNANLVHMCSVSNEEDSQSEYKTPEEAVSKGADVVIVGREICDSCDVTRTAMEYKMRSYSAYLESSAGMRNGQ